MKIRNMKPRSSSGGYERVFNNKELGDLLTKIQATVISNGSELERLILEKCTCIDNLDVFINDVTDNKINSGIFVSQKKITKKSKLTIRDIEPDLLIFIVQNRRICKIIELKDGEMFDTKKSKAEKTNLITFTEKFGAKIPFVTDYYICCFNQTNKEIIYNGFKGEFEIDHILTGEELCNILQISYKEIIEKRKSDAEDNLNYFVEEIKKINIIR